MSLSNDLISQFVKITKDQTVEKKESTVYGTTVEYNSKMYVKIDGSDLLTPITTTADLQSGERVTVMIKDHTATVTGNITSPSASSVKVNKLEEDMLQVDKLIADKATIKDLEAVNANITNLKAKDAEIEKLVAKKATIEDLNATNANITNLKAKDAEIEKLVANKANITDLDAINADIKNLKADKANVNDLTAINADIKKLKADKADIEYLDANYAKINYLESNYATIDTLNSNVASINKALIDKANVNDLNATNANVSKLQAGVADINTALIGKADISVLEANYATINQLDATNANVKTLQTDTAKINNALIDKANITDLNATNANVTKLQAGVADINKAIIGKADIGDLNAANANIQTLTGKVADINTLVNGNLTSDNIQSLHLTSANTTIDNAVIKNAMIDSVSANKVNSGSINTNKVSIQSDDGSMILQGNLQQFKDEDGKVRIQIGKDAKGNFTFVLYDKNGTGQLINQNGIQSSNAIADGLIVDSKVAENANIAGSKLDIDSVVTEINNGTTTIKGTKIYLDDKKQTLDLAFNKLSTTVENLEIASGDVGKLVEKVSTNTTNIEIAQGKIDTLISNTTITKENGEVVQLKDEYNSTKNTVNSHTTKIGSLETNLATAKNDISSVSSKQATLEQNLNGFKTTVSDTYATKSALNKVDDKFADYSTTTAMNSAIDQKANEITSAVSETYATKTSVTDVSNNLKNNYSTTTAMNSAIKQKGDSILSTVSSTYATKGELNTVDGKFSNYSTTSQMNSAINQKGDSILSTVSSTYTTKADFNNLSIGGRNYLVGTKTPNTTTITRLNGDHYYTYDPYTTYNNKTLAELGLSVGDILIVSFDYQITNVTTYGKIRCELVSNTTYLGGIGNIVPITSANATGKYKGTTKVTEKVLTTNTLRVRVDEGKWTIKISNVKLEKGSIATSWSPAPEDFDNAISAVDGKLTNYSTTTQMNSAIDQKANEIKNTVSETYATKASLTTVDNKFANYSTTKAMNSAIDQKANEITSAVSETYATKTSVTDVSNNLKNNYSTTSAMNSAIKQKGDSILSTVSSTYATKTSVTDVSNNLKNNYSTTTQMNSAINQKGDSILSTVSSTYTTKADFNNLSIGGRNLVKNSALNGLGYWSVDTQASIDSTKKLDKCNSLKISVTGNANYSWKGGTQRNIVANVKKGDVFTVSGYYFVQDKNTLDSDFACELKGRLNNEDTSVCNYTRWNKSNCVQGQWTYFYYAATINQNVDSLWLFPWVAKNGTVWFAKFKVEKGNKATDWSPAPEDFDNAIDTVDGKFTNYSTTSQMNSAIDQKANEITSTVSSTYATKTSVTDIANNLKNNYSTTTAMNSAIKQKSDSILSTVSSTYATKTSVTDVSNNLKNNYSTTSQMNSAIKQKGDSILSTVSSTYTTKTDFNNLSIGGRNFLSKTNIANTTTVTSFTTDNYYVYDPYTTLGCKKLSEYGLVVGDKLTVSFDYKITNATTYGQIRAELLTGDSTVSTYIIGYAPIDVTSSSTSGRYVGTLTLDNKILTACKLRIRIDKAKWTIKISNAKLEKGSIATSWTPSPEDFDVAIDSVDGKFTNYSTTSQMNSAINQKANEITSTVSSTYATKTSVTDVANNLKTNYSTTSAMNSAIKQKGDSILSTVSSTYTTKADFNKLNIGGRNLVKNSIFKDFTYWSKDPTTSIDSTKKLDGYNSLKISVTGYTDYSWKGAMQRDIITNVKKGELFTVSGYYFVQDKTTLDSDFTCELKGRLNNRDVSACDYIHFNKDNCVQGQWTYFYYIATISQNVDSLFIYPWVAKNGTVWFTKLKVEKGNKATDWSPAPEDFDNDISSLTTRMSSAESKLTKDSLVTTIGSYYTTSSDVNGLITSKGYATSSQVTQTANELTAKFTKSGGYNLIENSSGLLGAYTRWTSKGLSNFFTVNTGDVPKFLGSSCCWKAGNTTTSEQFAYSYRFKIKRSTTYTLSGILCADGKTTGADIYVLLSDSHTSVGAGDLTSFSTAKLAYSIGTEQWWKKFNYTFTTGANDLTCVIRVDNNGAKTAGAEGFIWFGDLQLEEGSVAHPWSPHPSECYTGITQISANGVKVMQSNYNGHTDMTSNGFYVHNGKEDVLKCTADGLYVKGRIDVVSGSVPSTVLTGTIDNARLNSSIVNGASNGSSAKSTLDSNSTNWINAYNRVKEWAKGAITGSTSINGGMIATGSITAKQLYLGDLTNFCNLRAETASLYGFTTETSAWGNWYKVIHITRDTCISGNGVDDYKYYECYGGESFRIKFQFKSSVKGSSTSGGTDSVYCGVNVGIYGMLGNGTKFYQIPSSGYKGDANATERTVNVTTKLPDNARYFGVFLQFEGWGNWSGECRIKNVEVLKMSSGELIVDGAVTASKINVDDLSALNATIGGFNMYEGKLVGTGGNGVGMSGNGNDWAFWAGASTGGSAPFHVGHEGNLFATQANISGTITGSTINGGTINGTSINSDSFAGDMLAIDGTISANNLDVDNISSSKYPATLEGSVDLYVNGTSGNDDIEIEDDAVFKTLQGAIDAIPKFMNGKTARITLQTDCAEDIFIYHFSSGALKIYFNGKTLNGYIKCYACTTPILIYGGSGSNPTGVTGYIHPYKGVSFGGRTVSVGFESCLYGSLSKIDVYGADRQADGLTGDIVGVAAQAGSNTIYCNAVHIVSTNVGFRANNCARINMNTSSGVASRYGFQAVTGGIISFANNAQSGGTTAATNNASGGQIWKDKATFASGNATTGDKNATQAPTTKTLTIKSKSADTYRSSVYKSWKKDGTARQGDYGYGDCNGCWFFGAGFAEVKGKSISKVTITITRQSGGTSSAVGLVVKSHGYASRPSGAPSYRTTAGTLSLATGKSGVLTITNSTILKEISSGAVKGFGIQSSYTSALYAVCSGSVTVKITYTD